MLLCNVAAVIGFDSGVVVAGVNVVGNGVLAVVVVRAAVFVAVIFAIKAVAAIVVVVVRAAGPCVARHKSPSRKILSRHLLQLCQNF